MESRGGLTQLVAGSAADRAWRRGRQVERLVMDDGRSLACVLVGCTVNGILGLGGLSVRRKDDERGRRSHELLHEMAHVLRLLLLRRARHGDGW